MPFIMPEGTRVPTGTDNYALTDDMRKMAESQSTIVSVASVTMRSALVAQLTAAGRTPTTARPLWVDRADLPAHYALEFTVDGTNWGSVPAETRQDLSGGPAGFTAFEGTPRIVRQGNVIVLAGGSTRSGTTTALGANTPMQWLGVPVGHRPYTSRRLGLVATSLGPGEVRYDSSTACLTVQYLTAQSIGSGAWWGSVNGLTWTMDA